MLDSLSFALSQIGYLVNSLSKKTFKTNVAEISQLINQHGFEAERHLYRSLFSAIDFTGSVNDSRPSGFRDYHQTQFLIQEINSLFAKPHFVTVLCYAIDHPFSSQKSLRPSQQLLPQVSKTLHLNRVQEVSLGLALLTSLRKETRDLAQHWLKHKLPDLLRSYVDADAGNGGQEGAGLQEISIEIVHLILTKLREDQSQFGISDELVEAFLRVLRKDFPKQRVPVVLHPLLYSDVEDLPVTRTFREQSSLQQMVVSSNTSHMSTQQNDSSLAELLEELGYNCTSTLDEMRITLAEFGIRDITAAAVARCISMFMRTCEGQISDQVSLQGPGASSSVNWKADIQASDVAAVMTGINWNVDNFMIVIKELNPNLQFKAVIQELDHPGFEVKSKNSFMLLKLCLFRGVANDLPIEHFYRPWKNAHGQLSFLRRCLMNPDVICLAYWRYRQADITRLKQQPDEENRDIQIWRNIDLVESLLTLSNKGFYAEVKDVFKFPLSDCPDILIFTLLQTTDGSTNILKQELLATLVPVFLGNHVNSFTVFAYAWTCSSAYRPLLMHAMVDWYQDTSDKTEALLRVARILDFISDMKALNMLLSSSNSQFVLSLSFLASKRDYLKMEMILNEKVRENGESFVQASLIFLAARCPKLVNKEEGAELPKQLAMDPAQVQVLLRTLEVYRSHLSTETASDLSQMMLNFNRHFNPGRPALNPVQQLLSRQQSSTVQQPVQPPTPNSSSNNLASLGSQMHNLSLTPTSGMTAAAQLLQTQVTPNTKSMSSPQQQQFFLPKMTTPVKQPMQLTQQDSQALISLPPLPEELQVDMTPEGDQKIGRYMSELFHGMLTPDALFTALKEKRTMCTYFMRVLAEEFAHIPDFPEKERSIMADLFGQIFTSNMHPTLHPILAYFLRLLVFALTRQVITPADRKLFDFGLLILDRCKTSLSDYRYVARHLLDSHNFQVFPKELQVHVQIAAKPDAGEQSSAASPFKEDSGDVKDDVKEEKPEEVPIPPENVLDAVYFIFNNLSKVNVTSKAKDLQEAVPEEYVPWLGQYLVRKRVTTEPNFHELFISLLDIMDQSRLREVVLRQTLISIRALLQNMRPDLNDYNDRTLLKNIGRFLGLLTIGKNKPILYDDMDLKGLLLEAYYKGQVEMHYAVPFVTRALEGVNNSIVFKPPNPWTMGILRVLKELHMDAKVKNSLKFEVEILCKKLNVNFDELQPAYYLRDTERIKQIDMHNCRIRDSKSGSAPAPDTIRMPLNAPAEEFEPAQPPASGVSTTVPHNTAAQAFADAPGTDSVGVITAAPFHSTGTLASGPLPAITMPPPSGPVSAGATPPAAAPLYPRFRWADIDPSRPLSSYLVLNNSLPLLSGNAQVSTQLRNVLEHTVTALLDPVAQRCVRIVLATVEGIVRKDFALDPDETRMRNAAHNMARFLTAGMALITCRDALSINLITNIRDAFTAAARSQQAQINSQTKDLIEEAANTIAQENLELCTAYIQRACVEKALIQLDVKLETDFRIRIQSRQEGRRFCDTAQLQYQAEVMPHRLRKAVGGPQPSALTVYSEYAHCIPGFAPNTVQNGTAPVTPPQAPGPPNEVVQLFDTIINELERQLQYMGQGHANRADDALLQRLRLLIDRAHLAKQTRADTNAAEVVKATIHSLFQTFNRAQLQMRSCTQEVLERYKEAHTTVLRLMYQPKLTTLGYSWMSHLATQTWTEIPNEEYKWNSEAFVELLKIHIISLQTLDSHLAEQIRARNLRAIKFVMELFMLLILCDNREPTVLNECDLTSTIHVLNELVTHHKGQVPEDVSRINQQIRALLDLGLLETHQQPATTYLYSGCSQAREFDDPAWLQETSESLMKKWFSLYNNQRVMDPRSFSGFVKEMTQVGILKTDDLITRFFRLTTDYVMEHCFRALLKGGQENISNRMSCYVELDAYIRLIAIMVRHSGEQQLGMGVSEGGANNTKINLLNKVLGIICGTLLQEQDIRSDRFHPMPFQRIFILLFSELLSLQDETSGSGLLSPLLPSILAAFSNSLHIVRPSRAPSFTYSWVEVLSHRILLSKFLNYPASWPMYAQLLVDLLKFLNPFLASANLLKTVQLLYKGTLRVILILLHDFADFISEYHHYFCDVIPPNCIQLRNLILSAFPKGVNLLDPIHNSASVCYPLPEMQLEPKGSFSGVEANIMDIREEVDQFLNTRTPVTFLTDLQTRIRDVHKRYNLELTNALVLYVGRHAVRRLKDGGNSLQPYNMTHCVETELLQALVMLSCTEGRYLLLNTMANQLRYPNSHTFYFSQILLFFFRESNNEQIKEQITRVLLERLIVNRPHPWGLLLTFTELLKNNNYRFWEHEFVRCAPYIERLLESVARSCVPGFRMPPVAQAASPPAADFVVPRPSSTGPTGLANGPATSAPIVTNSQ